MVIEHIQSDMLKKAFIVAANTLEKNKEMVNELNVFPVPDGDTGTNMSLTVKAAIKQVQNAKEDTVEGLANALAKGSLMGARGNSGVILSQFFRGFSKGLKGVEEIDVKALAKAFEKSSETAYKAVMKPIEGTILTVGRECAEKAVELAETETDIVSFLEKVIAHGEVALSKTPEMLEVLKQAGVVDAGGKGLILILKGGLNALKGEEAEIEVYSEEAIEKVHGHIDADHEITFGYCTEFIINNTKENAEKFRSEILEFGDSLLVVGGEDIIKVHIHTNDPGKVLEKAVKLGELIDIKIDNMRYQHQNRVVDQEKYEEEQELKKFGFIAVSMGEGIKNVFEDLNVDYVIAGGQTMNPSTEDMMKAIDSVRAEHIIILPNNSNIILAANQAQSLSEKDVHVLPTKTVPQGISAMLMFEEEADVEENIENMTEAFSEVKTGQVTFAVRDTVINDKEIKKDDIMGLCDGSIDVVGQEVKQVTVDLVKDMAEEGCDIVTLFYGEDVKEEEAEALREEIEAELGECDVEVIYGGQPLYYYLISVE